ncbi:hypothetical protein GQ457_11G021640 [Hibiscus cannabinus]
MRQVGKELKSYDENDAQVEVIGRLHRVILYLRKIKGFGVRISPTVKSQNDGRIISKILMCHKEGYREEKWNNLPNRKCEPKPVSRV